MWREYRRRSNQLWLAILGFVPYAFVFAGLEHAFRATPFGKAVRYMPFIYMLGLGVIASRVRLSCPRCGQRFFGSGIRRSSFARACQHCRLPFGAASDAPERERRAR